MGRSSQKSFKPNYQTRSTADMQYIMLSSKYFTCDYCGGHISIFRNFFNAILRKKGATLRLKCHKCGHINERVKGSLNEELVDRWNE